MSAAIRWLLALVLIAAASYAQAAFHLFRIEQIYTNADGSVQFVVLLECCGTNGENVWGGQTLRSTASGQTKTFPFPSNLPSGATANRRVLVATPGFAALGIVTPDFVMPANFLPIGGGSLNYAGQHQISFGPMPTDGVNALLASGAVVSNLATNFAGQSASVTSGPPAPPTALVIEYYNALLDHYFITHLAAEIAILDAGVQIRGWTRTQQSFRVFTGAGATTSPVCRYYIPPGKGDSHFYGRGTVECNATGQNNPTFVNEDPQFFHVILPDAGVCPAGTIAAYRVFSNRPDANHRYTIERNIRDLMVSEQRWLAEGDGPDLVVMCVPPTNQAPAGPPGNPAPPPPPPDPYMPPGYGYDP